MCTCCVFWWLLEDDHAVFSSLLKLFCWLFASICPSSCWAAAPQVKQWPAPSSCTWHSWCPPGWTTRYPDITLSACHCSSESWTASGTRRLYTQTVKRGAEDPPQGDATSQCVSKDRQGKVTHRPQNVLRLLHLVRWVHSHLLRGKQHKHLIKEKTIWL